MPAAIDLRGAGARELLALDLDTAGRGASHAAEHLGQLGLAVAADTGHAHDLSAVDVEVDVVEGGQPVVAASAQAADLQTSLAVVPERLLSIDAEGRAADHHAGQLALVGVARCRAHHAAGTHDADTVADSTHLAQLVADEDDRQALGDEAAQCTEERLDLLWHEHGRGLIEDEHAAVARQGLDDLDALLLADREVLHDRIGAHGDAEAVGRLFDRSPRGGQVEAHAGGAAEDDVLGDAHRLHQAEVLGDHADAGRDGVARGVDPDGGAVDLDAAGVRAGEPVQDAHQRRLAGAVLAEQSVDLTPRQGEVHRVVGDQVAETLGDAT